MNVYVWQQALRDAAQDWLDQADDLYAAKKCLTEITPSLLGTRVSPAAQKFLTHWSGVVEQLRKDAEGHGQALTSAALTWNYSDQAAIDALQERLPWSQRNLGPMGLGR